MLMDQLEQRQRVYYFPTAKLKPELVEFSTSQTVDYFLHLLVVFVEVCIFVDHSESTKVDCDGLEFRATAELPSG